MKKAAVAGGALWVIPAINSFASPAGAASINCPTTSGLTLTSTAGNWQTPASHVLTCNTAGLVSPTTDAVILYESTGTGVGESVNMDSNDWGTTQNGTYYPPRSLPSVPLCSYYVWRNTGGALSTFTGTITPPAGFRIAAVAWNTSSGVGGLANTTAWRGAFTYDASERPLQTADLITLAASGASVTISLNTSSGCDPVRVFIEHTP